MKTAEEPRVALVTGATNGIGYELTRKLLADDWEVAALIRSEFRRDDPLVRDSLARGRLRTYRAELTDFQSLRNALERIKTEERSLDTLFNNAGGSFPKLDYSKQGRELHFELHAVVSYIIFMELKELLRNGTMRTVINTSSSALKMVRRFNPDKLERPDTFKKLLGPYATSKLALSLWTSELAPSLSADGIRMLSVDPGGNNTIRKDKNSGLPLIAKMMMKLVFPPPTHGASLLYQAAAEANRTPSGSFLLKNRPYELPFAQHGRKVLELVRTIYEKEYAA
ncbi:SDR family NAD(P)-dependent oxidoreductase [Cohnella zeiphila]|uniref:SDR family NAD(P)-dependent oxidoreductase n=1 Tax=Cohnella zeiphila TaxID=2761120 RepID=A0A7X0VVR7_9BACL|nr:SDR family NAD(P)-dependent oxidoreductase [Cohnella zeiphila]MBB6731725.1 SDR family NAD(P)-dependent oxidoreductase [Cohnella zeiphila]